MSSKKRKTTAAAAAAAAPTVDNTDEKEKEKAFTRVPLAQLKSGHLLSRTEYLRVVSTDPLSGKMRCEVLRGDKGNDLWDITTSDDLLACSTEYVAKEEKLSKTELANKLVQCKDNVFKVVFRPVLNAETLTQRLKDLETELKAANSDADRRRVAKQLLEVPERTIRARLISPNTVLGHSLVDDLDQPNTQKVEFRNVSHANILALTVSGTRYILK